ncbi:MAG: GNAT family N-acetyltransferase [Alphaproteobacteria bacterium]|nr:GNAT family N-acetyltransferase [Alphaproteobacteria bacterium]
MNAISHQATNVPFYIRPVTKKHAGAFYDLIQEQAEQHDSASHGNREAESWKLFEAVQRKEVQAFLVVDRKTDKPSCAVTFFDCWTAHGHGLYLEDIVTTKKQRGRGVGHFAMAALAQRALSQGYSNLAWECAANNLTAHRFYDSFGSERHDNLLTWRLPGPFSAPKGGKGIVRLDPPHPDMVVLMAADKAGATLAKSIAYRSYSTFRLVSGMHVETFAPNGCGEEIIAAMLEKQIQVQAAKGWTGHVDLTVSKDSEKSLAPVIRGFGFEPLSYGHDRMIPRCLRGKALETVANAKGALPVHNHSFTLSVRPLKEKKNDSFLLSSHL